MVLGGCRRCRFSGVAVWNWCKKVRFWTFWLVAAGVSLHNLSGRDTLSSSSSFLNPVDLSAASPDCTLLRASIYSIFLTLPLSCYLILLLCSNHFLCWPCTLRFTQPNFKQIWHEGVGLCNRGGEEGAGPVVSLWGKRQRGLPGSNEKFLQTMTVVKDNYVLF